MGVNERQRYRVGGPRRRITEGADEIRDRTIRRRSLHRDVFPADITGTAADIKAPGYHELSEQQAHEQGSATEETAVAAEDHNHDFTYAGLEEARSVATADATYTDPHEGVAEGINPFVAPGLFHMRTVSWAIKEGFEERYPTCPIDVFVRYDPLGGTAWGEWHKVAVVPPGSTQAFYETLENFDPNLGTVCAVDVKVLPRIRGDLPLRLVRTGSDGKVDAGFLPASVPTAVPVTVAEGGTGATSASGARTNLGLGTAAVLAAGAIGPLRFADGTPGGSNTIANTATETAFGSTYTIPAGRLAIGSVVRIHLSGLYGTDAVAPTLRIRVKFGSVGVLVSGAVTMTAGITADGWSVETKGIVTAAGPTGAIESSGWFLFSKSSTEHIASAIHDPGSATIDTTGTLAVTVTAEWGTADTDNTIQLRMMTLEIMDALT